MLKSLLAPALNEASHAHLLPDVTMRPGIPKVLHHVFLGRSMPPVLQENVRRVREANPDWLHKLYDDEAAREFIEVYYGPRLRRYFERIDPAYAAARADLLRYLLVYRFGGVYLDVKSVCRRRLSEVIRADDCYLLSHWPEHVPDRWKMHDELRSIPRGELQMWFIAGAAGHPFLRQVIGRVLANIDRYNPALHATGKKGTVRVTGPIAYTLAIHPLVRRHPHRFVESDRDLEWHPTFLDPTAHESLVPGHYSTLTHPVVKTPVLRAALGQAIAARRRAKLRAAQSAGV